MLKYLTGVAAIALAASTAMADPGGGKGGGHPGGGGGGGGNPHAEHGGGGGGERPHGNGGGDGEKSQRERGGNPHAERASGGVDHGARAMARGHGNAAIKHEPRAVARGSDAGDDKSQKQARIAERVPVAGDYHRGDRHEDHGQAREAQEIVRDTGFESNRRHDPSNWRWAASVPQRTRGLIAGCPPGLAKKDNGCLPPGLARGAAQAPVFYDSPNWWSFDDRWHDSADWSRGDTRYYDGYLVRYGQGGIDSWLPLLGGALSPGNLWPGQYQTESLPPYYQDYYGVGQPEGYRYYDDTLYRVDPQSNAITAISALLTGDTFQVGQPLPSGYDVYNVPYSYRDRYPDGGDADYRYSDGSIYQIDPKTQIVQAVIGLLT